MSTDRRLVCIAGMHRSGTSMVARTLHGAGLDLGDERRLMAPKPDNPDGFFEHLDFVDLNTSLLHAFGSEWDVPPPATPGWALAPELGELRRLAESLLGEAFRPGTVAGWKDPRNSLTLPFWRAVAPGLDVIVCLRAPNATARSLADRGGHSFEFGLHLWAQYYQALARDLNGVPHLVVHYDAVRVDPARELERLAEFIRLPLDPARLARATAAVRRAQPSALQDGMAGLDQPLTRRHLLLYDEFRRRAGPGYADLPECRQHPVPAASIDELPMLAPAAGDGSLSDLTPQERQRLEQLERALAAQFQEKLAALGSSRPAGDRLVLDFTRGGNSAQHTLHGWSVAEDNGTWTDGRASAIALPRFSGTGRWQVAVEAGPFQTGDLRVQPVTVRVNGAAVANWEVGALGTWTATVDGALLARANQPVIELLIPHAIAPAQAGLSADRRQLGLLVRTVAICSSA